MPDSSLRSDATNSLIRAAFGPDPGGCPLPASDVPVERWMRAVAWGARGHYARSRAELDALTRGGVAGPAVASLAWSTQASLLRQLGWHGVASGFDGRALAVVGTRPDDEDGVLVREARCDALTGLAADALGCGRLALGRRLLGRCSEHLDETAPDDLWRQRVRRHWVSAELLLAGGEFASARRHAETAAEISEAAGSARHRVKSDLLRSASMTGESDSGPAARLAADVLDRCDRYGLIPLKWAAAMLLSGVTSDSRAEAVRTECETVIRARGGRFRI
ncbi:MULTISPECIES: hypothetical protein [unclassified Rhodococcus (in: high G+C Gram-positive bacteria)]|uniref:hypothetical protein n=1 Tax=Rhodococcus TaxID=1827 RepID=UPI000271F4BC|nr:MULTISPECIES: hypothetical protein [unclassified Rhodococcus (in: high G+C Gram-positive bacteria)]EJI94720.1 hypothetical protein JVH1_7847 [Rhodococcus sp. JVH1]